MKKLLHLTLAAMLLTTGVLGFTPQASANTATTSALTSTQIQTLRTKVVQTGHQFRGVPYKFGAEYETSRRFDCSSFVQYVYKKNGIRLPRGARDQYRAGTPIARKNLKPGDLVFFSTKATTKYSRTSIKRIGHVGIYVGNNRVLHTFGEGGVKYSTMASGWWDKHYVGAARVIK